MKDKILLVDDDISMFALLENEFELEGFALSHEADGLLGLERALKDQPSLVVLDVQLPGLGGFEVCRRLRSAMPNLPVILLTSRDEESDKLVGFERGADDYVTKPFSVRELIARVQAVLRRGVVVAAASESDSPTSDVLYAEGLELRPSERRVFLDGEELGITKLEFDLLRVLMQRPGVAISREALAEVVWGNSMTYHDPTITATFSRLRRRLRDFGERPRFLETVRGVGYRFVPSISRGTHSRV